MRNLNKVATVTRRADLELRVYRRNGDEHNGIFQMGGLRIIASNGGGWDHVSVSHPSRMPTWHDMQNVHRAFFNDDETAVQFHVPRSEHINLHPFCLHLWRCQTVNFPRPPSEMIA